MQAVFQVIHPGCVVMEVKYNNFLLAYIKNILQISNKSETAVSKICTCPSRQFLDFKEERVK